MPHDTEGPPSSAPAPAVAALLARPHDHSPAELLQRTAEGSRQSFGALYDLTAPRVHAMMTSLAPDRGAAERLTRAAFQQVWIRAPRFRSDRDDAMRWILRIAYQAAHEPHPAGTR